MCMAIAPLCGPFEHHPPVFVSGTFLRAPRRVGGAVRGGGRTHLDETHNIPRSSVSTCVRYVTHLPRFAVCTASLFGWRRGIKGADDIIGWYAKACAVVVVVVLFVIMKLFWSRVSASSP